MLPTPTSRPPDLAKKRAPLVAPVWPSPCWMRVIAPNVTPASDSAVAVITMRRREVTSVEDAPAAVGATPAVSAARAVSAVASVAAVSRAVRAAP